MVLIILAAVFLGSFALLFGIWLISWSFIMRPNLVAVSLLESSPYQDFVESLPNQDLSYDLSGKEAIPSLKA